MTLLFGVDTFTIMISLPLICPLKQIEMNTDLEVITKFDDVTTRTLRALLCTDKEWEILISNKSNLSLESLGPSLSFETENLIATLLRKLVNIELSTKATTLDEDILLLSNYNKRSELSDPSGIFSNSMYAALSFRIEKKRVLNSML